MRERTKNGNKVTVAFTGDLMCYPVMTENTGKYYGMMFSRCREALSDCDYLVGNLETPVAGEELRYTYQRFCFNTPDEYLDALKICGFDLLSLATNHCFDRGEGGILRTLQACRARGLETVGTYDTPEQREELLIRELGGIRVAFLNYTYGINALDVRRDCRLEHKYMVNLLQPPENEEGAVIPHHTDTLEKRFAQYYVKPNNVFADRIRPYLERLQNELRRAKEQAEYVVLLLHCGGQYNPEPDRYTEYIVRRCREYGADLIVGNHPHVIQKCTRVGSCVTAYSLGNFMYMPSVPGPKPNVDHSYNALLYLTLKREENRIRPELSFRLMKVVEELGIPYAVDTWDLWQKSHAEKLREEILLQCNRMAGKQRYTCPQPLYALGEE